MATLHLSLFKDIPQRDKDLIYGYIRKIQATLPINDDTFYNIPESINYICALFYYARDKWDPNYIDKNDTLSNDGHAITMKGSASSSYGSTRARAPGIYRWKFMVHEIPESFSSWALVLGVWKTKSADKPLTSTHFTNSTKNGGTYEWGYAYDLSYGNLVSHSGSNSNGPKYGAKIKKGDIVEMILDLNIFTLRYKTNDQDMGIAFKGIEDTEYRVACSSEHSSGVKIEMLP